MFRLRPPFRVLIASAGLFALVAGGIAISQIEPGDRGVAPIDSTSSYEIGGVAVDISARDADAARTAGWREAQRKGWRMLYARLHGVPVAEAPRLPDSTLDSIVAGIVVEEEEISARRYIARLGVLFDRARAGALLGVGGQVRRSAPMLTIPVMWSGGAPQSFELRTQWQQAWARFRTGGTPIDYVRPVGTGADPLLLNVAQTRRPGRAWWRMLLDQYGASDVLVPEVSIKRSFPGGPVLATFTARHGPDGTVVDRFTLRAATSAAIPRLLDEGVRRIDIAYADALRAGGLSPDAMLVEEPVDPDLLDAAADDAVIGADADAGTSFSVQVDTPDAASLVRAEQTIRTVPGVRSLSTSSTAIGGVSVIRLLFQGDAAGLSMALAARGLRAEETGDNSFRLRTPGAAPTTPPPSPAEPAPRP
ncbi:heavy-metal-associated domain-containing protein [Sphingomonas sp.]|uniref:heavy-metal-associated domain-containing protein n=1 Tax=Sphingomonas sp. TaxID=28214 RepID=UPI002ED85B5A